VGAVKAVEDLQFDFFSCVCENLWMSLMFCRTVEGLEGYRIEMDEDPTTHPITSRLLDL